VKLETRIKRQFKAHVEKRHGLITAPDELLNSVLKEVARWLKEHEQQYQAAYGLGAREALRDLRLNLLRERRPSRRTD
jgi:hypothetical protein